VLLLGSAAFASTPPVVAGGFLAGAACACLAAPRVVAVEKDFALRGDARDAARAKKARALAVTLGDRVRREPPLVAPALVAVAALALSPALRWALAQAGPALVVAAARPGALAHRALGCPPRFG
jgi:hypothetical protein